jgi:MoxR-like ATPase
MISKSHKIQVSRGEDGYTVIDSNGNAWTNFPYHLKKKAQPGIPAFFEATPKAAHGQGAVGISADWSFSLISEKAYMSKPEQQVPASNQDVPSDVAEIRKFIDSSYDLKPEVLKMSELKWKYLTRSAVRGKNIMMTGPAGCGKTLAAKSLVKALDRPDFYFNLGATQDPRSTLIGNVHYNKDSGTYFAESLFVKAIQTPNAIILLDELTRAHPEAWNILMPVLDQGQRYLRLDEADNQQEVKVAEGVTFVATANIGAAYTATRVLDKAIMDRFVTIEMDLLEQEEEYNLLSMLYDKCDETILSHISQIAFLTRTEAATDTPRIEAGVSTRTSVEMAGLAYDGFSLQEIAEITVYPQYDTAGGVDSERTFVKQIVQKFVGNTDEELFTAEKIED